MIRELKASEVKFTIERCDEIEPFVGNCSAVGEKEDKECEEWIRKELRRGQLWAWCMVRVKAEWKGYSASDFLGCCSYKSKRDFMEDGYYEDMKKNALDELNKELQLHAFKLKELWE